MDPDQDTLDHRRSQRSMVIVRYAGAAFAAYQVSVYDNRPYPSRSFLYGGLAIAAFLAAGNTVLLVASRRARSPGAARAIGVLGIALDVVVAIAFAALFTFDQLSALWAVLLILPLEGAIVFRLAGALATWGATTVLYVAREVWGAGTFPSEYPVGVQWSSVTFRMGIALLIAMVAGLMARDMAQQRTQLREALVEVRRVDGLRAALVSTLAHDVRTPLTSIRGGLKLVLTHPELDPETVEELLRNADRQADRLERLAADLLDLARLEGGRLELALEDVALRGAVESALSYADGAERYEVRIDPELHVRADPGRLEQIVVNLASNALRYGAPPFVAEARPLDGRVTLELRDEGPGVPTEEVAQLFEPFRTEQHRGSVGLGLAIVKALAEAHGGRVAYRENRPRGACFVVELPQPAGA